MKKSSKQSSNKLTQALKKNTLSVEQTYAIIEKNKERFFESPQLELELLQANGFPIQTDQNMVSLTTNTRPLQEQIFCIVDIETNASKVKDGQIIELGAVKIQNGRVLEEYDSLVYAKEIPVYVQEVTGINPHMLIDAPPLQEVLEEFRIFLEDSVFVAHDINFDYNFISSSLEKFNLGRLENRSLCTINLAKRVVHLQRYGLDFLKQHFEVDIDTHHRALDDAMSTYLIFNKLLELMPQNIHNAEELIDFSMSQKLAQKEH